MQGLIQDQCRPSRRTLVVNYFTIARLSGRSEDSRTSERANSSLGNRLAHVMADHETVEGHTVAHARAQFSENPKSLPVPPDCGRRPLYHA